MLDRKQAEIKTKSLFQSISKNKFLGKECKKIMQEKYNIPTRIITKALNNDEADISALKDSELFLIMYSIIQAGEDYNIEYVNLENYFTKEEIKAYSNSSYKQEKKEIFPITIPNCIEVNPGEQWVTTMTARTLDELNEMQLINYNKNTQRNLTKKKIGNRYEYGITLKQKSVKEISELMKQGRFISNDITLNLNWEDPNLDFEYDPETNTIILNNGKFDIIDGYHRFRAIIKNIGTDENFDYNMVVNIMYFDEEKANRFIVQEDKRNKINSGYIKSLDTQNPVYMIVKRLNDDSSSYLCGKIGREDEENKVTFSHLFNWIESCFKIKDRSEVIKLTKLFKNIFNTLIENGHPIKDFDFREIGVIIMCTSKYEEFEAIEKIESKLKNIDELENEKFARRIVNKRTIDLIENFVNRGD